MSLFKALDLWAAEGAGEGDFTSASLATGSLFPDSASDQIVVGSLSGLLRIYEPKGDIGPDGTIPYRPEHLLLETKLDQPIVQVLVGQFVSSTEQGSLAILHPRKLVLYVLGGEELGSESEQVRHGSQYSLRKAYEHHLKRSAFNMTAGPFGGVKGRDFVAVQSLDGALSVFEQESPAFERFLPGALLPGPLAYAPASDSFLTVSSDWLLQSYKYQNLAVAANAESKEEAANTTSGKRVTPDWSMSLGEAAYEIRVFETTPAQPSVLVLGERQVFCFTEGGTLRFINRIDYSPSTFCLISTSGEGHILNGVGSHTKTIMFYCDTQLRWAAQLPVVPVALGRIRLGPDLEGVLVWVSGDGRVSLVVLGTEPSLYGLPSSDAPAPLDYAHKQDELRHLQARIRVAQEPPISIKAGGGLKEELSITADVPSKLDLPSMAFDVVVEAKVPSITVKVRLQAKVPLQNVILFVRPPHPIVSNQTTFSFSNLSGSQDVSVTFFVRYASVPVSLTAQLRATYCVVPGIHKLTSGSCQLPLVLAFTPTLASKTANHKLTLHSSRPTIYLNHIFPEMLIEQSAEGVAGTADGSIAALGFKSFGDSPPVSVLVSNNVQKYRVQGDALEGCWLLVSELEGRLAGALDGSDACISFSATLPLPDYFAILDHHFELGKRVRKLEAMLGQRCAQLRAVEKQLLSKFRDTTPTSLAHLDGLIDMTHRQVMKIADSLEELEGQVQASECALEATTHLIQFLLRLHNPMSPSVSVKLRSALLVTGQREGASWEARAEAAVSIILALIASAPQAISNSSHMTDTSRLKRQLSNLFDKLSKTSNIVVESKAPATKPSRAVRPTLETIPEDSNLADMTEGDLDAAEIPAGSTFGDMGGIKRQRGVDESEEAEDEDFGPGITKPGPPIESSEHMNGHNDSELI